jgi:secreted trypsin-like serine protease
MVVVLVWSGISSADAKHDAFDDVVLVGDANGSWCSGVVISPTKILTAKHCLVRDVTRVGIGASEESAAYVRVTSSVAHPTEDVALLTIDQPTTVARHERRADPTSVAPNSEVAVVGFGVSNQIALTGFGIRRARSVWTDGWGCDRRRANALACSPSSELLLRGGRGVDTCIGDSGGGAFEYFQKRWRLIGITSRGTAPKRIVCGEGGVYVRVDVINSWLEDKLQ